MCSILNITMSHDNPQFFINKLILTDTFIPVKAVKENETLRIHPDVPFALVPIMASPLLRFPRWPFLFRHFK